MAVISEGGGSIRRPTTPTTAKPSTTTTKPATSTTSAAAERARNSDAFERRNGTTAPPRTTSTTSVQADPELMRQMAAARSSANAGGVRNTSAGTATSTSTATAQHTYTVQSGDSRETILNKLGADGSKWNKLGDQATIRTQDGREIPYSQAYVLKPGDQVVFSGAVGSQINAAQAPAQTSTGQADAGQGDTAAATGTASTTTSAGQTTAATTNVNRPPPGFRGDMRWQNMPPEDRQAVWDDYNKSHPTTTTQPATGTQGTTGTQGATQTGPVDLSTMTQQQQYNYFQNLVESQGGTWKDADGQVNLVGIRSFQDGKPTDGTANAYDDTIYSVRMVDGQPEVKSFTASTDAGAFDPKKNNPDNPYGGTDNDGDWGVSHLADGFYEDAWTAGATVQTDLGLRQNKDVQVHFDNNYDGVIAEDERDNQTKGAGWGIQFHPAEVGYDDGKVGSWSAGCQVIKNDEWQGFEDVLRDSSQNYGQTGYSYLLIDSSDLPATTTPARPPRDHDIPE